MKPSETPGAPPSSTCSDDSASRTKAAPKKAGRWARVAALAVVPVAMAFLVRQQAKTRPALVPGLGGVATSIAYAPDGTLACASGNALVQKWVPEIGKWRSFQTNQRQAGYGYTSRPGGNTGKLRFSPDGKSFYTGGSAMYGFMSGAPNSADWWDFASRRYEHSLGPVNQQAFDVSADGKTAALGTENRVLVCPLGEGARFTKLSGVGQEYLRNSRSISVQRPLDLALSPDGKYLVVAETAGFEVAYSLYDTQTGRRTTSMRRPNTANRADNLAEWASVAWSPDGAWIVAAEKGHVFVWDSRGEAKGQADIALPPLARTAFETSTPSFNLDARPLAFAPDSKSLAIGGRDVRLLSVPALETVRELDAAGGVAFSPDGTKLATGHAKQNAVLEWHL